MRIQNVALIALFAVGVFAIKTTSAQAANVQTYENTVYGIGFQYPADWQLNEITSTPSDNEGELNIIAALCPQSEQDKILESECPLLSPVRIMVVNYLQPPTVTLDEYVTSQTVYYKQQFDNVKIIETNMTTLGGQPAVKLVYTHDGPLTNFQKMDVIALKDNQVYFVQYTVALGKAAFSDYLPIAQHVTNSFEFLAK